MKINILIILFIFSQVYAQVQQKTSDMNTYKSETMNDLFSTDWKIDVPGRIDPSIYNQPPVDPRRVIDTVLAARLQFIIDSIRTASLTSQYPIKGISSAVYIPWQGTWQGVTGVSYQTYPITPGMKLALASNTKAFIAALILKLAEMHILSLDDSLHSWLPGFQYVDSTITIRQLLNHTSGVFNFAAHTGFWDSMFSNYNRFWTPEQTITTFVDTPYFQPGGGWEYSNTNYLLAGLIIRKAVDTLVSYKLRQLILNPANLSSTFFDVEEVIPDTIAGCYNYGQLFSEWPRTSQFSIWWTAGAMFSTAENMVRWYYKLFTGQVISQSSLSQMLTFVPGFDDGYGLGIFRHLESGHTIFYHPGMVVAYRSYCGIDSASKICVSVLVNTEPSDPLVYGIRLFNEIFSRLVGIGKNKESLPLTFSLHQNYPNPFNPLTTIRFDIPKLSDTKLIIYDALGREITTLVNEQLKSGTYEVEWDPGKSGQAGISSGIYFYKLVAGDFLETKKMILLK